MRLLKAIACGIEVTLRFLQVQQCSGDLKGSLGVAQRQWPAEAIAGCTCSIVCFGGLQWHQHGGCFKSSLDTAQLQ